MGYYFKYYLDKKKDLVSEVTKERREMYQTYVDLILNIWMGTKVGKADPSDHVIVLQDFFKKNTMYASPKVIKSLSSLFQYMYAHDGKPSDTKKVIILMTRTIKDMRSDLGLSNKGLGENGEELIRPLIKDWDLL